MFDLLMPSITQGPFIISDPSSLSMVQIERFIVSVLSQNNSSKNNELFFVGMTMPKRKETR